MLIKSELYRKSIHLASSAIPLTYYYLIPDQYVTAILVAMLVLFSVYLEIYRSNPDSLIEKIFGNYFNPILRPNEISGKLTGATWNLLAHLVIIIIFPFEIAVISLLIMSVGDAVAGVIGMSIGRIRIRNKTLEGSLSGIIVCLPVAFMIPSVQPSTVLAGILVGMLVELLPLPINDNLTIPFAAGITMCTIGFIG